MITIKPRQVSQTRRVLKIGKLASPDNRQKSLDAVAIRHITNHPEYKLVIQSLKEGASVNDIVRYFVSEQLVSVSEKTFTMYLYIFKKHKRELFTKFGDNDSTIDKHVRGDQPNLDVDREIDRAIRFQKIRVGLGFTQEQNLTLPMEIVNKDVRVLGQLLELKARREGFGLLGRPVAGSNIPLEKSVEDKLKEVKRDEEGHQSLFKMASDLVESASQRND